ncbi:MAG TPA: hypothetical protein VGD79_00750 [Thermoanaerobaculia bacterium]|jgi:hypothetical protein
MDPIRREFRIFSTLATVGWLALGVSVAAWLLWAGGGASRPGESWDQWMARIRLLGRCQEAGIITAATTGMVALFVPRRHVPPLLKIFAALPFVGSVLFFGFIYVAMISLGIR